MQSVRNQFEQVLCDLSISNDTDSSKFYLQKVDWPKLCDPN